MTTFCSAFLIILCNAQSQFEIFPNLGGVDNQSQLFSLLVEGDSIYAIGSLIDTNIGSTEQVRPWLAAFDHLGNKVHSNILNDTISQNILRTKKNQIYPFNNYWLYFTESFNESGDVRASLLQLDLRSGNILKSRAYSNPIDSNESILPSSLSIMSGNPSQIVLATTIEYLSIPKGYLLIVDSNFLIIKEIFIEDNGRDNYIYKVKMESDSTIVLIGNSRKRNDLGIFKDIKPYYMKIDTSGNILKFNLITGFSNPSILFGPADTQAILDNDDDGWVVSCLAVIPTGNCSECYNLLPYIISLSPDFSIIKWSQTFSDNGDSDQRNLISALIKTSYDGGFIIIGQNHNKPNFDSYIFKISHNGDSLWSRHFIPLNWDSERVLWAAFQDIKITSYNTLVVGGTVADLDSLIWKSWILHLDSLGCLIPGCAFVSSADDHREFKRFYLFYPNPATDALYMLSLNPESKDHSIKLLSSQGIVVKSIRFINEFNKNYIFDLSNISPGIYAITVTNSSGKIIQTEKIVVQ